MRLFPFSHLFPSIILSVSLPVGRTLPPPPEADTAPEAYAAAEERIFCTVSLNKIYHLFHMIFVQALLFIV